MLWAGVWKTAVHLTDSLLPASCVFCGEEQTDELVCSACYRDLPWITHACERCGTPLATALPARVVCGNCQQRPPAFESTVAPLHYDFPIDAAVKALKFERRLYLAPALASLMLSKFESLASSYDALVPVPLYRWRQAARGFNQALELARYLRRHTGVPISECVRRTRRTEPQSGLDAVARKRNLGGAFEVIVAPPCKRALIVDDVMTTGETCRALASILLAGGVEYVGVLTIAHASP